MFQILLVSSLRFLEMKDPQKITFDCWCMVKMLVSLGPELQCLLKVKQDLS